MFNPDVSSVDVADLVKIASSQLSFQMKGPAESAKPVQEANGLIAAAAKQLKTQVTESLAPAPAPVKKPLNENYLDNAINASVVAIKDLHWTDAAQVAGAILSVCAGRAQKNGDYRAGDNFRKMVATVERMVDAG